MLITRIAVWLKISGPLCIFAHTTFERVIAMKTSPQMRTWYAFFAVVIWLGMYLTGFSIVHWLLYLPAAGLTFAALTGICPSQIAIFKLFDLAKKPSSGATS